MKEWVIPLHRLIWVSWSLVPQMPNFGIEISFLVFFLANASFKFRYFQLWCLIFSEELTKRRRSSSGRRRLHGLLLIIRRFVLGFEEIHGKDGWARDIHHEWRRVIAVDKPVEMQAGGDQLLRGKVEYSDERRRWSSWEIFSQSMPIAVRRGAYFIPSSRFQP